MLIRICAKWKFHQIEFVLNMNSTKQKLLLNENPTKINFIIYSLNSKQILHNQNLLLTENSTKQNLINAKQKFCQVEFSAKGKFS